MRLTGKRVRNQPESLFPSSLASILLFSSVAQSCPTLCDPVDCSTPGLPVHQQLPELAQTHVHRVGDATNHLVLCRPLLLPPSSFPASASFTSSPVSILVFPASNQYSYPYTPPQSGSILVLHVCTAQALIWGGIRRVKVVATGNKTDSVWTWFY